MKTANRNLPTALTAHDVLKSFAVMLMILDHAGYYFFQEWDWLRVLGRASFPIWFFLIGYSKTQDLNKDIWVGGFILLFANIVAGMSLFPLNVLFNILFIRYVLRYAPAIIKSPWLFSIMVLIITVLVLPSLAITEYGLLGLLYALLGYIIRRRRGYEWVTRHTIDIYGAFVIGVYLYFVQQGFNFALPVFLIVATEMIFLQIIFRFFKKAEIEKESSFQDLKSLFKFFGRRTLFVYVLHLVIFKALAMVYQPDIFILGNWIFYSPTGV